MMRLWLQFICWFNRKAKALSIRLVYWTGKSREYIHPKHLIDGQGWYLRFIRPDAQVLDVGCGTGAHSIRVAMDMNPAGRVTAIDRDPQALDIAERTLASEYWKSAERTGPFSWTCKRPQVELIASDLERTLPIRTGKTEVVLCLDVLEHLHRRDRLLAEINRVLVGGGLLLLAVPKVDTTWKERLRKSGLPYYSDPDHKIEYTEEGLKYILWTAGFKVRNEVASVYDTPWIGLIDLIGGLSLRTYRALTERRRRLAQAYPKEQAGFYWVCVKR